MTALPWAVIVVACACAACGSSGRGGDDTQSASSSPASAAAATGSGAAGIGSNGAGSGASGATGGTGIGGEAPEIHWQDPLGYTKPRPVAVAMPDEASCPNKWYVDLTSGGGTACTETAPCGDLEALVGKPGTTGGPAYVYVRGVGQLYLFGSTFYGSKGNEIVVKPWPGAGVVSFEATADGGSALDGEIHDVILDGGPDLDLEFVTHDSPRYALAIRADDITVYRCRFRAKSHDGPLVDIGSFTTVSGVAFVNSEFYDSDHVPGAQQNMYWGPGAGSTIESGRVESCLFHDLGGEAIELNPRVYLDNMTIAGNAFHNVGKQTCSGGWGCRPAITIDGPSVGGESRHVRVVDNLVWDTGSGGIWDRSGTDLVEILQNTFYDFAKGSDDPNPEGVSGYQDGAHGTAKNNILYASNGTAPFDGSPLVLAANACTGCDVAGTPATFVSTDENSPDFLVLAPGAAAVNAGVDTRVTEDYFGKPRPEGGGYDVGASETK